MIATKFHPCFRGQATQTDYYVWVCRKSKMAAINRKKIGNYVYLSSRGQATRIDYWEYGKHRHCRWNVVTNIYVLSYEQFTKYFQLMDAIFDFQQARTYDSIPNSLSLSPDPGNMGVAVGISLLSCVRAEIDVISYLLPVNGSHHWFTTYPYTGQYFQ